MRDRKDLALKIIIPVIFLCVVMGIWVLKNSQNQVDSVDSINPDFALHVTEKIDLDM